MKRRCSKPSGVVPSMAQATHAACSAASSSLFINFMSGFSGDVGRPSLMDLGEKVGAGGGLKDLGLG